MAEEQKNGLSEMAERGAGAAHAVQGAVKTGKAIAAASKGAAAGGSLGAATAAAWTLRKPLAKILMAAGFLFLLPVLYILLLPSMIFSLDGNLLSSPDGSAQPPVINNTAAIVENLESVGSSLNQIILESLEDLYSRIETDFADSSGDRMEITNPYAGSSVIDANLIIAQYCAAKDKDFAQITLADLERTVKANQRAIFSYDKKEVTYRYTYTDPETKKITVTTETVIYYTVVYNGNTLFADTIFFLNEKQKALAADYNVNLHLFLNDSFIVSANTTHELLAQLAMDNPYSGNTESFGSPFTADWRTRVTSEFGPRTDPITGKINAGHTGMDIGFGLGTEIRAVMSGRVIYVRYPTTGYGYHLAITHGNGLITLYAHCSKILVSEGDVVSRGDVIAHVGSTGRSTGPHLHFEVISGGVPQNPRSYLPG